jgi:type IV pilus assembly protein PilM
MAQRKRTLLPVGIHLTAEAVHMVQLEQSESDIHVVAKVGKNFAGPADTLSRVVAHSDPSMETEQDPPEARFAEARTFIRKSMATGGFKGKNVVISLPSESLTIQHVRMAPTQPEDLPGALSQELQGKLPYPTYAAVIRFIVAGTVLDNNETKQDVLVLAAPKDTVELHVSAMTRMGLNVVGVGVEPCAMGHPYAFNSLHTPPSQEGPPCLMLVLLGYTHTHVAIVRGQDTTFVKGVDHGTDVLIEAVAKARGVSLEEAVRLMESWRTSPTPEQVEEAMNAYRQAFPSLESLVDEIQSCQRYHASLARGARIDRLYFAGPGARDRGLVRVLSANLNVPCEVTDPIGAMGGGENSSPAEPDMAVAVGLSLFGAN